MMPTRMIYPGQVDEYYVGKEWLADWLDRERHPWMAVPQRIHPVSVVEADPFELSWEPVLLTRYKCRGPAPYVGAPYVYEWWVAVDKYGHGVGGREAYRQYILPFSEGFTFTDAEFCAALDRLEF